MTEPKYHLRRWVKEHKIKEDKPLEVWIVRNDEGLPMNDLGQFEHNRDICAFQSKSDAKDWADNKRAHVVELVEKPTPIVVSEEEAEMLKEALKDDNFGAGFISDYVDEHWNDYGSLNRTHIEDCLMRAYVNEWTVEKPKRYVLPIPGTDYHNIQMHGNAQYYAIKGTGNWRPDAIALGTDDAVKHGYTVTQSDIDAAPDWVKAITPVEVNDDGTK